MNVHNVQIISAPSILGLKPTGVELLAQRLLDCGLKESIRSDNAIIEVDPLNDLYDDRRDQQTGCLNPDTIRQFSIALKDKMTEQLNRDTFSIVLGGDCSIILGIMSALKSAGPQGLIFLDAHADFYRPFESPTGEVADMDLGIVTGCGPDILANIGGLRPYVEERHVIHVGQRDGDETKQYGSRDIKQSAINCFDLNQIQSEGVDAVFHKIIKVIDGLNLQGYWIHFDTDVISDDENPAVDYRLPNGMRLSEVEYILQKLISTTRVNGMSVTIYNPKLDPSKEVARRICECLTHSFAKA